MSWFVAFVLALCVPFAQLKTNNVRIECCCPDQAHCKCPDHEGDSSGQPSMRACHKQVHEGLASDVSSFVAPPLGAITVPVTAAPAPAHELSHPHDAPPPVRPDAPS